MEFEQLIKARLIAPDIIREIFGKLQPIHLMMLCGVSKAMYDVAWSIDLRGRRFIEETVRDDSVELLNKLLPANPTTDHACIIAAGSGAIDALKVLIDRHKMTPTLYKCMYERAVDRGQLAVLKLSRTEYLDKYSDDYYTRSLFGRHVHVARWLLKHDNRYYGLNHWKYAVFRSGNLAMIKMVHSFGLITKPDSNLLPTDNLEIIQWFVETFPGAGYHHIHINAKNREHFQVLDYLHEVGWREANPIKDAETIPLLEWYISHGYEIADIYRIAINRLHSDATDMRLFEWAKLYKPLMTVSDITSILNLRSATQIVQWAIDNDACPREVELTNAAAAAGRIDVLKLLYGFGCPLPINIDQVVKNGHCDVITWMVENGTQLTPIMYTNAIGNHNMIKFLHKLGCPLSPDLLVGILRANARDKFIIETMTQLRDIGCPWDSRVCLESDARNNKEIIEWVHKNGCPCCTTCDYWVVNLRG